MRYFREAVTNTNTQTRWDYLADYYTNNPQTLDNIQLELDTLLREILYVLGKLDVKSTNAYKKVRILEKSIHMLRQRDPQGDDIDTIMGFLWEIFTGWSWATGYETEDPIQRIFDDLF